MKTMFSSPTAIRVLKKQDAAFMKRHDLSSLRYLFLAGEPLDEPTARWAADALGVAIVDNYWQTEIGLADPVGAARRRGHAAQVRLAVVPGVRLRRASSSTAATGRRRRRRRERRADDRAAAAARLHDDRLGRRRALRVDVLRDDSATAQLYSTFDWATRDEDGYYFVLGRTDDVINVAGHRLGTREIEEAVQAHAGIAEVAVVGVHDELKGQVPIAFAVVKDAARVADAGGARDDAPRSDADGRRELGAIARPATVHFVTLLPKTRSGKLLRRSIQALAEAPRPGRPDDDRGSRPRSSRSAAALAPRRGRTRCIRRRRQRTPAAGSPGSRDRR